MNFVRFAVEFRGRYDDEDSHSLEQVGSMLRWFLGDNSSGRMMMDEYMRVLGMLHAACSVSSIKKMQQPVGNTEMFVSLSRIFVIPWRTSTG